MALTTQELQSIKDKIEADEIRPIKAIRELFPEGDFPAIRKQLFETFDRGELLAASTPATPPVQELTVEEKVARVDQQLERVNARKAKLEAEKAELEG